MDIDPNRRKVTAPGYHPPEELPTISGDRGLDHEEKLIFEIGRDGVTGVDLPQTQISGARLGGPAAQGRHRPAGPQRAGSDPPLCPPVADELRHRCRAVSAGLLHHEAQSAPE